MHNITNSNALLLYKVGPVLVCTPTLYVESITIPPNLNSLPGSNNAVPGMFKSMHGMVRVVDLRVRFGVDVVDRKSPGRIIISETTGGYVGLWVDEIEDVISFPEKGWSQLPAHVPREAFSRALICPEGIRLYAEVENLDKFKTTGYLRKHIESIKAKNGSIKKPDKNDSVIKNPPREKIKNNQEKELSSENSSDKKNAVISYALPEIEKPAIFDIKNSSNAVKENKSTVVKSALRDSKIIDKKVVVNKKQENIKMDATIASVSSNKKLPLHQKIDGIDKASDTQIRQIKSSEYSTSPIVKEKKLVEDEPENGLLWGSILVLGFVAISVYVVEFSGVLDVKVDSVVKGGNDRETFIDEGYAGFSNNSDDYSLNEVNEVNEVSEVSEVSDYGSDTVDISKTDEGIVIVINDYAEDLSEDELENYNTSYKKELNEGGSVEDVLDVKDVAVVREDNSVKNLNKTLAKNSAAVVLTGKTDENHVNIVVIKDDDSNALKEVSKLQLLKSKEEDIGAIVKTRTSMHVVVAGDTLWDIAKKYVNNPWKYPELARLSKIEDPDLIYPGQKVKIIYNTNK